MPWRNPVLLLLLLHRLRRRSHARARSQDAVDHRAGVVALLALGIGEAHTVAFLVILAGVDGLLLDRLGRLRQLGVGRAAGAAGLRESQAARGQGRGEREASNGDA